MMIVNQGAGKGLLFFFTPQWEKLASLKVTIIAKIIIVVKIMIIIVRMIIIMASLNVTINDSQ